MSDERTRGARAAGALQPVESVWDYPRPPRLEPTAQLVQVIHAGVVIAETVSALRVLETSHPPVFYIPPIDIRMDLLRPSPQRRSFCEFKGIAEYWDLDVAGVSRGGQTGGDAVSEAPPVVHAVAWSYPAPTADYATLRDHLAFYPGRVDACTVDGERVEAQKGGFYGGWITSRVRGPFKGG